MEGKDSVEEEAEEVNAVSGVAVAGGAVTAVVEESVAVLWEGGDPLRRRLRGGSDMLEGGGVDVEFER